MDQSTDSNLLRPFLDNRWIGFDTDLCQSPNILLKDGDDLVLLEFVKPDVYNGHYLFQSRGSVALKKARLFLQEIFTTYRCQILQGLTPLNYLGARWMNRKLGFNSYGIIHTEIGPCELVMLTKQEWENKQ